MPSDQKGCIYIILSYYNNTNINCISVYKIIYSDCKGFHNVESPWFGGRLLRNVFTLVLILIIYIIGQVEVRGNPDGGP